MSYDHSDYMMEQEALFWEQLPKDWHEDSVRSYLGSNGDAIDERIAGLQRLAKTLLEANFLGPALTAAVTAVEVMIQFFCVRPLVEGAFLSEVWAGILAGSIVKSRPQEQRKLLVTILKLWDVDLEGLRLGNGKPLWQSVHEIMLPKRNAFVHLGEDPSKEDVLLGLDVLSRFRNEVVGALASKLGFTLEKTGKWCKVVRGSTGPGHLGGGTNYGTTNPFKKSGQRGT